MIFEPLPLEGAFRISPQPISDSRGWFSRYFCAKEFGNAGLETIWVQCNHSFSSHRGSIRGLHYQYAPFAETKLVRCTSGAIFDVIVDVRDNSPTFLQWYAAELSAANKAMFYIPSGFAHGFQTLMPDTEVQYHHSAFYTPGAEKGLRFNDPAINISWPFVVSEISEKDNNHPFIKNGLKGY
jgi:dTDP-4-dehydrorhamnose 3,5-epimerase